MDKRKVLVRLDAMIHTRLFGDGPWLTNRESGPALDQIMLDMKVQEEVPGDPRTSRWTALGKELNLNMVLVFLGHWDERELIDRLQDNGLLEEHEADRLHDRLDRGADPESLLRPRVQRAYLAFYQSSKLH
jgi:hypothetical protein